MGIKLNNKTGEISFDGNTLMPNATGITDGYVLTADGSNGTAWEALPASGIANVVEDTTPQLGGQLDANGNSIIDATQTNPPSISWPATGTIEINGPTIQLDYAGSNVTLNLQRSGVTKGRLWLSGGTQDTVLQSDTGVLKLNAGVDIAWPTADGTANQVLKTNGSGQLGWATALSNVVEDTTPTLGGNLDFGTYDIVDSSGNGVLSFSGGASNDKFLEIQSSTSAESTGAPTIAAVGTLAGDIQLKPANTTDMVYIHGNIGIHAGASIMDSAGLELIETLSIPSAVNHLLVQNATTTNNPALKATGGDTDIDLELYAKGAGVITLVSDTEMGAGSTFTCVNSIQSGTLAFGGDGTLEYMGGTFQPNYQIHGTTSPSSGIGFYRWTADNKGAIFDMAHSRGASQGTHTAVTNADGLALIRGWGSDGTQFKESARLKYQVDGTVSTGVVPGAIQLSTTNSSGALVQAVLIRADQSVELDGQLLKNSNSASSTSGAITFDCQTGQDFTVSLTENITSITLSNPGASGMVSDIEIVFSQTASYTVSGWPAAVKWPGGTAPTITTGSGAIDVVRLTTRDGGTTWLGTYDQNFS